MDWACGGDESDKAADGSACLDIRTTTGAQAGQANGTLPLTGPVAPVRAKTAAAAVASSAMPNGIGSAFEPSQGATSQVPGAEPLAAAVDTQQSVNTAAAGTQQSILEPADSSKAAPKAKKVRFRPSTRGRPRASREGAKHSRGQATSHQRAHPHNGVAPHDVAALDSFQQLTDHDPLSEDGTDPAIQAQASSGITAKDLLVSQQLGVVCNGIPRQPASTEASSPATSATGRPAVQPLVSRQAAPSRAPLPAPEAALVSNPRPLKAVTSPSRAAPAIRQRSAASKGQHVGQPPKAQLDGSPVGGQHTGNGRQPQQPQQAAAEVPAAVLDPSVNRRAAAVLALRDSAAEIRWLLENESD